jgi:hypothetical protein
LSYVRDHPAGVYQAQGVSDDLEATEEVLVAAEEQNVRFHLAIDF